VDILYYIILYVVIDYVFEITIVFLGENKY